MHKFFNSQPKTLVRKKGERAIVKRWRHHLEGKGEGTSRLKCWQERELLWWWSLRAERPLQSVGYTPGCVCVGGGLSPLILALTLTGGNDHPRFILENTETRERFNKWSNLPPWWHLISEHFLSVMSVFPKVYIPRMLHNTISDGTQADLFSYSSNDRF